MIHKIKHFVILSVIAINFHSAQASTDQEAEKRLLIDELIQEHGFDEQYVLNIFENMSGGTNEDAFEAKVKNMLEQANPKAGKIGRKSLDNEN